MKTVKEKKFISIKRMQKT